jgi:hypothetical protein
MFLSHESRQSRISASTDFTCAYLFSFASNSSIFKSANGILQTTTIVMINHINRIGTKYKITYDKIAKAKIIILDDNLQ